MSSERAFEIVTSPGIERCRRAIWDARMDRFPGAAERFAWWLLRAAELTEIELDRERLIDPRTA